MGEQRGVDPQAERAMGTGGSLEWNSMNREIPFTKMSGSGNDFVMIDHRQRLLAEEEIACFTRAVCRRGPGIGADGVILIEESPRTDVDFQWRYFNADGSVGEMCGNGAMCGARFAVRHGIAPATCRFETEAGDIEATVAEAAHDPRVEIRMVDAQVLPGPVTVTAAGRTDTFRRVQVGVPHAVAMVEDADAVGASSFDQWGRTVRLDESFLPTGTNVNVIHMIDGQTIRMRTYERGVEAETLACGTGAVASAIVAVGQGLVAQPVSVVVSSGRTLTVSFRQAGQEITDIRLAGEARFVASGVLDPEGLD